MTENEIMDDATKDIVAQFDAMKGIKKNDKRE
jgi:hypothetical protein